MDVDARCFWGGFRSAYIAVNEFFFLPQVESPSSSHRFTLKWRRDARGHATVAVTIVVAAAAITVATVGCDAKGVRPCGHVMLAALTEYRNRLREWLHEVVTGNHNRAAAMDRRGMTAAVSTVAAVSSEVVVATMSSVSQAEGRPPQQPPPPQLRPPDTAVAPPQPYTNRDEEFAATVLSSMPEDMPLPPLAYIRRRSSSKTHTRLYRIRLPPKPRRAKR